jgi:hypothetical protein
MENNIDPVHREDSDKTPKPVETDYNKHSDDPGPAPEAVTERNDKGAGPVLKWILPVFVVILMIYWFVFRK